MGACGRRETPGGEAGESGSISDLQGDEEGRGPQRGTSRWLF